MTLNCTKLATLQKTIVLFESVIYTAFQKFEEIELDIFTV